MMTCILHMIGTERRQRLLVKIYGHEAWLKRKSFDYLLVLAMAKSVAGETPRSDWVRKEMLEDNDNTNRHIYDLREDLGAAAGPAARNLIENNGNGSYRLTCGSRDIMFCWNNIAEAGDDLKRRMLDAHAFVRAPMPVTV